MHCDTSGFIDSLTQFISLSLSLHSLIAFVSLIISVTHSFLQPFISVTPNLATNASAAAAAAAAAAVATFNPYLSPVSPALVPTTADILPTAPVLISGNPAAVAPVTSTANAAAQKLLRTDRLEV